MAWVALADNGEIGVDVELLRPMPDAIDLARQNFSAAECAELAATPSEDQALAFLLGWTRKEACLKAIGSGLSISPNIFTAGLAMDRAVLTLPRPTALRRSGCNHCATARTWWARWRESNRSAARERGRRGGCVSPTWPPA